jgi:TolB protein
MAGALGGRATRWTAICGLAALAGVLWINAHSYPASAAFPGRNGLIAFTKYALAGGPNVFTIHADGSHQRQLTNGDTAGFSPAFSPNGRKIVFGRDTDPSGTASYDLFTMRPDGSHKHQLTHTSTSEYAPQFSPTGRKIVYQVGSAGIFTIRIDGTHTHPLTNGGTDFAPTFSPDGRRIVFVRYAGMTDPEIVTMRADGTHQRQLTHNDDSDTNPDYSPNGEKIVWSGYRGRPEDILIMNADGTHQRNLTKNQLFEFDPVFSPNGTRIAYDSSPVTPGKRGAGGDDYEIFVMHVDGSHRHALTHNGLPDMEPSWQPKHRRHH